MRMSRVQERSDRVYLDPDIARCEPHLHCPMRSHCARYMAAIPAHGGSMMDGTSSPLWSPSGCGDYIPAAMCLKKGRHTGPERRKHWTDHSDS